MGGAARGGAGRRGAAAMLALALVGCRGEAKETKMAEPGAKTERVYLGRFSLALPAGMSRSDGECKVRRLALREVELAPPHLEAWKAAWAGKLAEVAALRAQRLRPTFVNGEVLESVEPGKGELPLLVYHHGNSKTLVTVAALADVGGGGLWLTAVGGMSFLPALKASAATVARAYRPRVKDGPPLEKEPQAFLLARGAVLLPFAEQESAHAIFKGGPHGAEVDLATETVAEVEQKGLFERFSESVVTAGAAFGAGVSTVRSGKKSAGALAGEELVLRDGEKGKLAFIWRYRGEAGSGARPEITLQMSAPEEPRQEVMARWDALLASLLPAAEAAGK